MSTPEDQARSEMPPEGSAQPTGVAPRAQPENDAWARESLGVALPPPTRAATTPESTRTNASGPRRVDTAALFQELRTQRRPARDAAPRPATQSAAVDPRATGGATSPAAKNPTAKRARPIERKDREDHARLNDPEVVGGLMQQYAYDQSKAKRRLASLTLQGDKLPPLEGGDTRNDATVGECLKVLGEDKCESVSELMAVPGAWNFQCKRYVVVTATGSHMLRTTDDRSAIEVATSDGWVAVDDDWVRAQNVTVDSDVVFEDPAPEPWKIEVPCAQPSIEAADGPPFYNERGGGDTCALHGMNHFVGTQVSTPDSFLEWSEVNLVKDGRVLPKTDPRRYDKECRPPTASTGLCPLDMVDYLATAAKAGKVDRRFGNLAHEEKSAKDAIAYVSARKSTHDRFLIGRQQNTHAYTLRRSDKTGKWYLLDNRANPREFDTPEVALAEFRDDGAPLHIICQKIE
jgi:hypothetical protein